MAVANNQTQSKHLKKISQHTFFENKDENYEEEEETLPKWYEEFKNDPPGIGDVDEKLLTSLRFEAQHILDEDTKIYNSRKKKKQSVDEKWIETAISKGTLGDKIAALIVTIQNSPIHSLTHLNTLINMVKVGKKRQCIMAMESLSELFAGDLLMSDRRLRRFDQQSLKKLDGICGGNGALRRKRLAAWLFEERLKELFELFVQEVEAIAKDTVEANREKAIITMNFLLSSNPEQEDVLLSNIINKLGDPSQKVASKVTYCLTQLLRTHPNMKQVVMNAVEKIMFRPHIADRTQYYCICFLSQFVYRDIDKEIARNAINIYFSFFKALTRKGEVDSRLMGALLMGVKRAYPFAKFDKGESSVLADHIDTLYRIVHLSNFNISLHTLCLLQQATSSTDDRFYSALYKKLLDKNLANSTHHAMLINLLFKAMLHDDNRNRVIAFIKRLLQICLNLPVPLVCSILYMISHIVCKRKGVLAIETKALEPIDEKFKDVEDEEEKYFDVEEEDVKNETPIDKGEEDEKKPLIGWYHCAFTKGGSTVSHTYDPFKRSPAYANAENSAYFELILLKKHFHPTVALFAQKIINSERIQYSGDPLCDFTLVRFLERFVFKNPKKVKRNDTERGPDPVLASRKYYHATGIKGMAVTSSDYLKLKEESVPVDELFLYRYMKEKYGERGYSLKKEKGEDEDDDDIESVASDEFEEMLEGMMGKKDAELNFMEDIGDKLSNPKAKKELDKIEEDESENEESSEEEADEEDDDLSDLSDGDDDEVLDFSGDDDGEVPEGLDIDEALNEDPKSKNKSSTKVKQNIKKKAKLSGLAGLFAPAEEFSEILDDAGNVGRKVGMAHSVSNRDNSAQKQLSWEASRNRWLKGTGEFKRRKSKPVNKRGAKRFKKK